MWWASTLQETHLEAPGTEWLQGILQEEAHLPTIEWLPGTLKVIHLEVEVMWARDIPGQALLGTNAIMSLPGTL